MPTDAANLAPFLGRFRDGWTDQDIAQVLPDLSAQLGVELCCLWDYVDEFGFGGDSQLVRHSASGLVEAPSALYDLLLRDDLPATIDFETDGDLVVEDTGRLVTSDHGPNLALERR